ncbi:hypothetical protein XaFJ1_GM003179 [Xanthomonas albilineans]|nr:hypothetical protein XaFJ1_GM003179 [Xanthomonas albilineans]
MKQKLSWGQAPLPLTDGMHISYSNDPMVVKWSSVVARMRAQKVTI